MWKTLKSRRSYKCLSSVFKIMNEEAPSYLINLIPKFQQFTYQNKKQPDTNLPLPNTLTLMIGWETQSQSSRHAFSPPAWGDGGLKILEKSLLGGGGSEIFILVVGGNFVGGGSGNFEVKIKTA